MYEIGISQVQTGYTGTVSRNMRLADDHLQYGGHSFVLARKATFVDVFTSSVQKEMHDIFVHREVMRLRPTVEHGLCYIRPLFPPQPQGRALSDNPLLSGILRSSARLYFILTKSNF